jgi:hypothetical protein
MPSGAAVRARHMKSFVEALSGLEDARAPAILAATPPGMLETIEQATPSAWLPVELNVQLTELTTQTLADEAFDFYRRMMLAEYETSLFKSFVAMSIRLLGLAPSTFVKMTPRGWPLVFRRCGKFRALEQSTGYALLRVTELPEICTRNEVWLESVRAGFASAFELTKTPGRVEWHELSLPLRRAIFVFRW